MNLIIDQWYKALCLKVLMHSMDFTCEVKEVKQDVDSVTLTSFPAVGHDVILTVGVEYFSLDQFQVNKI